MIRILVLSPTRLMNDLIRAVCENAPGFTVVGTTNEKKFALQVKDKCDVIVVGAGLANHEILSLVITLARDPRNPPVVVVGLVDSPALVIRFLEAGAASCVREQDSVLQMVTNIRLAAARQTVLASDLYSAVIERVNRLAQARGAKHREGTETKGLTRREREILDLVAQGYDNRAIAHRLTIELGTTKNHVHNILCKLNVKSRQDAALVATLELNA